MTIAAGFNCADGILVCADTEVTQSTTKTASPKVYTISWPRLKVIATGAGDVGFLAWMFQECDRRIRDGMSVGRVTAVVETIVKDVHTEHVFPSRNENYEAAVEAVFGIWTPGACRVLRSERTTVTRVAEDDYQPVGFGAEIGRFIVDRMRSSRRRPLWLAEAVVISVALLRDVKRSVQGCGGRSHILVITGDGNLFAVDQVVEIEYLLAQIDAQLAPVLFACAHVQRTEQAFDSEVAKLERCLREFRQSDVMRAIRGLIERPGASPEARRVLQGTKRGRKRQPPSRA